MSMVHRFKFHNYIVGHKKLAALFPTITLVSLDRFLYVLHH